MKRKPKVLVVPHYSGSEKKSHVFKIVITEQIKKKLENAEKISTKENNSS